MSWTRQDDRAARCPGPPGAVGDGEAVARIVVEQRPDTGYVPFARRDLTMPAGDLVEVCGEGEGLSVDRCSGLSNDDLVARSAARAAAANARRAKAGKAANQFPHGAMTAAVAQLRALAVATTPGQVVFVYDDPIPAGDDDDGGAGNAEHAVIRIAPSVEEERVARLIDRVVASFDRVVVATGAAAPETPTTGKERP